MNGSGSRNLLYIEPSSPGTEKPLVDTLTRKMAAALRASKPDDIVYCGIHECICGALSECYDFVLPSGAKTNSLCVHSLAHHRDEVPAAELERVACLDSGECRPRRRMLRGDRMGQWSIELPLNWPKAGWWKFWRR